MSESEAPGGPASAWAAPAAVDPTLRETARTAWTFGLLAMGLAMLTPCSSYMTTLIALPLGMVAMSRAKVVLESGAPLDEATELYAKTGRITGLSAALFSGMFLLFVASIILLYMGLIAAMFGAAFVAAPPPMPVP